MSEGEDGVVGKAVAYRTGDASHREEALRVWGSMHGRLQGPLLRTTRLARAWTGIPRKAHE